MSSEDITALYVMKRELLHLNLRKRTLTDSEKISQFEQVELYLNERLKELK